MSSGSIWQWLLDTGAAVAAVLLVFAAPSTNACSITVREPLKYAFKQAPIAFEGTLEHVGPNGDALFRIERQWKGQSESIVVVRNPQTSCGYHGLVVGERYVIVPESDGSIHAGSHVELAEAATSTKRVLDRRASWWRCPLSSLTLRAIARRVLS